MREKRTRQTRLGSRNLRQEQIEAFFININISLLSHTVHNRDRGDVLFLLQSRGCIMLIGAPAGTDSLVLPKEKIRNTEDESKEKPGVWDPKGLCVGSQLRRVLKNGSILVHLTDIFEYNGQAAHQCIKMSLNPLKVGFYT
jgi:hypothetical protein